MDALMIYRHIDKKIVATQAPDIFQMACQRMIYGTLASNYQIDLLEARVREIYYELAYQGSDQDDIHADDLARISHHLPSLGQIADYLDDENYSIIHDFLSEYKDAVSPEDFEAIEDSITVRYDHEIGCMLEDWVEQALMRMNMPYQGGWIQTSIMPVNVIQQGQNILVPDFMKEGVSYALVANRSRF